MAPIAPFSRHSRPPARLRHPPAPSGMASTATAQPGLAPPRPLLLPDASVPPSIKDHSPSCQVSHALSLSLPTRPPFFSPHRPTTHWTHHPDALPLSFHRRCRCFRSSDRSGQHGRRRDLNAQGHRLRIDQSSVDF